MITTLLEILFPPKLGHVRISYKAGNDFPEDLGDGIIAGPMYNVKQDAIERHWKSQR
jgi:hypothetical protein